jgi:hypothetical protein
MAASRSAIKPPKKGVLGMGVRNFRDQAARRPGKRTSIPVERANPALALYERLGFVRVEERGPYFLMELPAPS